MIADLNVLADALLERATGISELISALQARADSLFQECADIRSRKLRMVDLGEKESKYWTVTNEIERLKQVEEWLLEKAAEIENGVVDDAIRKVLEEKQPVEKLSKRRLAIKREEEFRKERSNWRELTSEEEDLIPCRSHRDYYARVHRLIFPSLSFEDQRMNGRFIQTGRRKTKVTGRFDPLEAGNVFFEATADTHGGKVRGGSKASRDTYVKVSGHVVRKR